MIARERSVWRHLSLRRTRLPAGAVLANYSRELLAEAVRVSLDGSNPRKSHRVILPSFVCNTLVDAVLSGGGEPVFHGLDPNLTPRLDEVERQIEGGGAVWIVVDYFGMQPEIPESLITKARHLGCCVIHDAAHSFLGMMAGRNRDFAAFDYSVFSIYKAFSTGTGAVGIGPMAFAQRASLPLMIVMAGRKVAKHMLAFLSGGRLVNRGMEVLRREAPVLLTARGGTGGIAALKAVVEHRDYPGMAARAARAVERIAAAAKFAGATPVFDDAQCCRNVLQGFPLRFASQAERDRAIAHFRRYRVDAYTWPTFSTLADDAALWGTLLVLPTNLRAARALEALESDQPHAGRMRNQPG